MTTRYVRTGTLAVLLALTFSLAAQAQEISIAAARALGAGQTVTVRGVVTRALGRSVRFQDATAAIATFQSSGTLFDAVASGAVAQGDEFLVTGTTSEFNGLFQISPVASFTVASRSNALPAPQIVTLLQISTSGEDYESELVQVNNLTLETAGDVQFVAARNYAVSDATLAVGPVTLRIQSALDSRNVGQTIPANPIMFVGVFGQFDSTDPRTEGYQLLPIELTDVMAQVGTATAPSETPAGFALGAAYPNPFNPSTTLRFTLGAAGPARLAVYDALGREVAVVAEGTFGVGAHAVVFDAGTLPSGVYLARLTAGAHALTQTITLTK